VKSNTGQKLSTNMNLLKIGKLKNKEVSSLIIKKCFFYVYEPIQDLDTEEKTIKLIVPVFINYFILWHIKCKNEFISV
jgi:poly(3-hydroxyalkanoate) synthetase